MLNNIVMNNMLNQCVYDTSSATVSAGTLAAIVGIALVATVATIAIVHYILNR